MEDSNKHTKSKSPPTKPRNRDQDQHSEQHSKGHLSSHGAASPKLAEGLKSHKTPGSRSPKGRDPLGRKLAGAINPGPTEGPSAGGGRSPRQNTAVVNSRGPSSQPSRQTAEDDEPPTHSNKRRCIRDPLVIAIVVVAVFLVLVAVSIGVAYVYAGAMSQDGGQANTNLPTHISTLAAEISTVSAKSTSPASTGSELLTTIATILPPTVKSTTTTTTTSIPPIHTTTQTPAITGTLLLNCSLVPRETVKDLCWLDHRTLIGVGLKDDRGWMVKFTVDTSTSSCVKSDSSLNFTPERLSCASDGTIYTTISKGDVISRIKIGDTLPSWTPDIRGNPFTIANNDRFIAITSEAYQEVNIFDFNLQKQDAFGIVYSKLLYTHLTSNDFFLATTGNLHHTLIIYDMKNKNLTVVSGLDKFNTPKGVTSVKEKYILVADKINNRLSVWTFGGTFVKSLLSQQVIFPGAIAINEFGTWTLLAVNEEISDQQHNIRIILLK